MTAPRLRSLTVKGFRAYGAAEQTLNLPADSAVVWGPNSLGKTSLAEAIEFLLTGHIARRELMASSQDEFADALRNAHLPPGEQVYVSGTVIGPDGASHQVKRVLTADYAKKQDCKSSLEIDSKPGSEADLVTLGVSLSQPPLAAPVLAQHTLSHIFSVRPQDRATYFNALLEVADLDDLRNGIAGLSGELAPPVDQVLTKFDALLGVAALKPVLSVLGSTVPDLPALAARFDSGAHALIAAAGAQVPAIPAERLVAVARLLEERRNKTFPLGAFNCAPLAAWSDPLSSTWTVLDNYIQERAKIDEETRQLVALFDEALKLPAIAGATDAVDCPLCETSGTLTRERVLAIRTHVENAAGFTTAETAARSALGQLAELPTAVTPAAENVLPGFAKQARSKRRADGFTIFRLRTLLDEQADNLIRPWLASLRALRRAARAAHHTAAAAKALVKIQTSSLSDLDPPALRATLEALSSARESLRLAVETYAGPAQALVSTLAAVIDLQSDTAGWQDFLDVAKNPAALRNGLIEARARAKVFKELEAALKQIDKAKAAVLDDKFSEYSDVIQTWWERLRPDEPTFFSAVQPRKGAKRTIDFKAGLSANPDRSSPKMRDVIAIFSQSQPHCLGLALFLARAQHEGSGFIVLDDPVLSSDDDYRVHFNSTVLEELLNLPIQIIVLTQDHAAWEDIQIRHRHRGISMAQLYVDSPQTGTIIENTSDTLMAKVNRAKSLAKGGHPDVRKECGIQLRDAGELFCKEILVKDKHNQGDQNATLSDFEGKVLEWLCPHVEPFLEKDPSHPGKLEAFRKTVNTACHDNTPPTNSSEMTQACGEIRYLANEYLPHLASEDRALFGRRRQ